MCLSQWCIEKLGRVGGWGGGGEEFQVSEVVLVGKKVKLY